jgi:hypothetical protein
MTAMQSVIISAHQQTAFLPSNICTKKKSIANTDRPTSLPLANAHVTKDIPRHVMTLWKCGGGALDQGHKIN